MKTDLAKLRQYRITRFWIGSIVVVGLTFSGMLNVLNAPDTALSTMLISGWPPFALFVTMEMIVRVPARRRLAAGSRIIAATLIAGIAGYISFEHQLAYIHAKGFTGPTATLMPLSIDGVLWVATVSLFEVTALMRELREKVEAFEAAKTETAEPTPAPVAQPQRQAPGKSGRKPGPQPPTGRRRKPPHTALKPVRDAADAEPTTAPEPTPPTVRVVTDPASETVTREDPVTA